MVLLFTILGECVVSSEMGPRLKSRLTVVYNNNKYKSRVFGRSKMGKIPPRVKDPNLYVVRHDHRR